MTELPVPPAPRPDESSQALAERMVSMNFILKSTQSEVIKLEKVVMRYKNRQEELEKKQARLEELIEHLRKNQQFDISFRTGFWPRLFLSCALTCVLTLWLGKVFF
jgi:hypothetical protein